jgi:hypothetical protein
MTRQPLPTGPDLARALVGAWRLVSWRIDYPESARVTEPFGPAPEGLILYTADGYMSAAMQRPARARLSRENLAAVTDAEKAAAFVSYLQYSGHWRVAGADVHHVIELAMNPNLLGTRQVRGAILRDDELELRAAEPLEGTAGVRLHRILWRRARPHEI